MNNVFKTTVDIPAYPGDIIYFPWKYKDANGIAFLTVTEVIISGSCSYVRTDFETDDEGFYLLAQGGVFEFSDFGKIVFHTYTNKLDFRNNIEITSLRLPRASAVLKAVVDPLEEMTCVIDRKELLSTIRNMFRMNWEVPCTTEDRIVQRAVTKICEAIKKQPTVAVSLEKQIEGEWIKDEKSKFEHRYYCSACNFYLFGAPTNYCEECGAKMKVGADGE